MTLKTGVLALVTAVLPLTDASSAAAAPTRSQLTLLRSTASAAWSSHPILRGIISSPRSSPELASSCHSNSHTNGQDWSHSNTCGHSNLFSL